MMIANPAWASCWRMQVHPGHDDGIVRSAQAIDLGLDHLRMVGQIQIIVGHHEDGVRIGLTAMHDMPALPGLFDALTKIMVDMALQKRRFGDRRRAQRRSKGNTVSCDFRLLQSNSVTTPGRASDTAKSVHPGLPKETI